MALSSCRALALAALVFAVLLNAQPAGAQLDSIGGFDEPYPLRPADTSSPRDTLRSFLRDFSETVEAWRGGRPQTAIVRPLQRAADTLDFSDIRALSHDATVLGDMALLQEILDRVELPQYEAIPGDADVAANDKLTRWVIPNTRLEIVKIEDGPRTGEFLFSRETVDHLPEIYELAREIPYKTGAIVGIYEEILASPGQWMPHHFPDRLPGWATTIVAGQGIWQWIAVLLLAAVSSILVLLFFRLGVRWDQKKASHNPLLRFGQPLALVLIVALSQIDFLVAGNVIGLLELPLDIIAYTALAVQVVCGSWLVVLLSGRLADAAGRFSSPASGRQRFDVALTRILFRLVSIVVILFLAVAAADAIGIPIAPLVAGLGVGGLAIALAVRPTLENVIGGLTLFADRPVRVGDFFRYGTEIGTVEQIGLRSTRIRTLEQSIVTVPNSEFSQMHLDNFTARYSRLLRTVLQLRYETTPDQMRFILARLREMLVAHPRVTPDPARVRLIGYGAYSKDVEVFAYLRCQDQNIFLAIQEDILLRIEDIIIKAGSGFAFPSQTNYVARDTGIDAERGSEAEAQVGEWRTENRFPFPEFEPEHRRKIEDSLDYPPEGAHDHKSQLSHDNKPSTPASSATRRGRWRFGRGPKA